MRLSWEAGAPGHGSISCQPYQGRGEACAQGADCWAPSFLEDSSKDLKLLIKHLLELLALEGASAHGRDNALNLLIKVVPRKSPKETNNTLSLWVIDQGEQNSLQHSAGASCPSASGCRVPLFCLRTPFCSSLGCLTSRSPRPEEDPGGGKYSVWCPGQPARDREQPDECLGSAEQTLR